MMKLQLAVLALLAASLSDVCAAPDSTNTITTDRVLIIDPCSTAVSRGRSHCDHRHAGARGRHLLGVYKIKVSPYFFKSEKGRLAIVVSDESMSASTGESRCGGDRRLPPPRSARLAETRKVEATATPSDLNHGTLRLWLVEEKMGADRAVASSETPTASVPAMTAKTNVAANLRSGPSDLHP